MEKSFASRYTSGPAGTYFESNGGAGAAARYVIPPIAAQAKAANPSIVDSVSNFYAQHTTLCKTLGGAALSICLAKVAQHTNA